METTTPTPEATKRRNTNKRRMAWSAFFVIAVITGKYLFFVTDVAVIAATGTVVSALIWANASIIGAYVGFSFLSGKPKV